MSHNPNEQAPTRVVGAPPAPAPAGLLHTYDGGDPHPQDVAGELRMAVKALDETATASIHNDSDMIRSAVTLRIRLRALAAAVQAVALDAEPDGGSEGSGTVTVPQVPENRCPAAHPDDPDPCDGPPVVTVLDRGNAGLDGCEHHGTRLLASLDGGRVYGLPDAPDGAAIRVFKAADRTRPFPWMENGPRTLPGQLSRAENRRRGEGQ